MNHLPGRSASRAGSSSDLRVTDPMRDWERVLGRAKFEAKSDKLKKLITEALSKFPDKVEPLRSVSRIQVRKRGRMKGLVGLTTYCCVELQKGLRRRRRQGNEVSQTITFYSELLNQLSDSAAIGVIAHELAHSWLNEHVSPEASKKRETEADELARRWGYAQYLDALVAETMPV